MSLMDCHRNKTERIKQAMSCLCGNFISMCYIILSYRKGGINKQIMELIPVIITIKTTIEPYKT